MNIFMNLICLPPRSVTMSYAAYALIKCAQSRSKTVVIRCVPNALWHCAATTSLIQLQCVQLHQFAHSAEAPSLICLLPRSKHTKTKNPSTSLMPAPPHSQGLESHSISAKGVAVSKDYLHLGKWAAGVGQVGSQQSLMRKHEQSQSIRSTK